MSVTFWDTEANERASGSGDRTPVKLGLTCSFASAQGPS
jgi:hypothetical protein